MTYSNFIFLQHILCKVLKFNWADNRNWSHSALKIKKFLKRPLQISIINHKHKCCMFISRLSYRFNCKKLSHFSKLYHCISSSYFIWQNLKIWQSNIISYLIMYNLLYYTRFFFKLQPIKNVIKQVVVTNFSWYNSWL